MTDHPDRVVVGIITKAHGVRGAVVVRPQTDAPASRFAVGSSFHTDVAGMELLTVTFSDPGPNGVRLRFDRVTDRTGAESLRGTELSIERNDRRSLDETEFWPDDLVGLSVELADGAVVGHVTDVEMGEAQDRLVIRLADGGSGVLPFVADLVPTVDLAAGVVVVDPPDGWTDTEA